MGVERPGTAGTAFTQYLGVNINAPSTITASKISTATTNESMMYNIDNARDLALLKLEQVNYSGVIGTITQRMITLMNNPNKTFNNDPRKEVREFMNSVKNKKTKEDIWKAYTNSIVTLSKNQEYRDAMDTLNYTKITKSGRPSIMEYVKVLMGKTPMPNYSIKFNKRVKRSNYVGKKSLRVNNQMNSDVIPNAFAKDLSEAVEHNFKYATFVEPKENNNYMKREQAVTKLQAGYRGKMGRIAAQKMKNNAQAQENAATRIQALYRGKLGRNEAQKRKAQAQRPKTPLERLQSAATNIGEVAALSSAKAVARKKKNVNEVLNEVRKQRVSTTLYRKGLLNTGKINSFMDKKQYDAKSKLIQALIKQLEHFRKYKKFINAHKIQGNSRRILGVNSRNTTQHNLFLQNLTIYRDFHEGRSNK